LEVVFITAEFAWQASLRIGFNKTGNVRININTEARSRNASKNVDVPAFV
jgi:hypothetical protein